MDLLIIGAFSIAPSPRVENNPSGFAREKMMELTEMVGSDLFRAAQVVARLLWVASTDNNSLNKVVALKGAEKIMAQLGLDLLQPQVAVCVTGMVVAVVVAFFHSPSS